MRTFRCSDHFGGGGVCPGSVCCGGVCPGGMSAQGGLHPPVDRQTDTCENITFPQLLLRTVIT